MAGAAAALLFAELCIETFAQENSSCISKEQNKGAGINFPSSKAIFLPVLNAFWNDEFISEEVDRMAPRSAVSASEEPEPPAAAAPVGAPLPSSAQASGVHQYFAFLFYENLNLEIL